MDYYNSGVQGGVESMDIADGTTGDAKMENGGKRVPWKTGGIRKKRKKTPAEKNLKLKKYVQPKNAVMCLNELVQGVVFTVEQEGNGSGTPVCVSVEVHGQKYRGFGSSKQIAKQAAAEAALVSFVKPPSSGGEPSSNDNTPWAVLACFAMYKLFNEWREGRIGMCQPFGMPMVQDATMSQTLQNILGRSMQPTDTDDKNDANNVFAAYLGGKETKPVLQKEDPKQIPNPAKQVPDNASAMHPVMLLHQMRPTLVFVQSSSTKKNDQSVFSVSCNIDNQTFIGEGVNMKKAKLNLALKANKILFGVNSTYTAPN